MMYKNHSNCRYANITRTPLYTSNPPNSHWIHVMNLWLHKPQGRTQDNYDNMQYSYIGAEKQMTQQIGIHWRKSLKESHQLNFSLKGAQNVLSRRCYNVMIHYHNWHNTCKLSVNCRLPGPSIYQLPCHHHNYQLYSNHVEFSFSSLFWSEPNTVLGVLSQLLR